MKARLSVALVLLVGLTACSSASADDGQGDCGDWPAYASPSKALEQADWVVTADVVKAVGSEKVHGTEAHVYSVRTMGLPLFKGDAVGHEDLKVVSTPQKCAAGDPYPEGDPLRDQKQVILFLTRDGADDMWRTISPTQGVLPATGDAGLPDRWPT
ncbi:hypothetical protein JCM4814A_75550 [Streptomyces phaeofaciens JCM 4814]|uniref:Lipoprotein n=1 Tax=Streptomyces phaeofaciens TaxID=68254 RepID=A0A918HJ52_9ACTN|nr:hypothetical protein [Streptomyces phaeofaciens]GGT64641.1 hypothetical protein GCM10010226_48000 [Streptomyces phaeofaciens]